MKFDKKYPNMKPLEEDAPGSIMRSTEFDHCHICGALTEFIDMDFECYICSEECADQLMWEFLTNIIK